MTCPRCGQPDVAEPACPRCGVVFAKLTASQPRATRPTPPAPAPGLSLPAISLGLIALGLLAWLGLERLRVRPTAPAASVSSAADPAPEVSAPAPPPDSVPPPSLAPPDVPAAAEALPADAGVSEADVQRANALVAKARLRQAYDDADLAAAEALHARYPAEPRVADVLVGVLLSRGARQQEQRRFTEAQASYRRAIATRPENASVRKFLVTLLLETGDFAGAESEASQALALEPRDAELLYSRAYALFRQDRNREALEAVQASLQIAETPPARTLLERLIKTQQDERGLTEQQLAHFHVRYDGDEHADVGREILRQLERHYATLVRSFDYQPQTTIPVILFSKEQYYTASGAPAWSGGVFDGLDGRIRIPIGGLTASLTPEMDATLIHELTHAFVNELSRGLAPREIHEGVAQYMEGKRVASRFTPAQLALIADGRAGGVGGFYAQALSFVEYLVSMRGTGGVNDALRAIGETGSVDAGFQRVYGKDYAGALRDWRERLKQQYG